MILAVILLLIVFIGLLALIAVDKWDRTYLALIACAATYLIIVFIQNASPTVFMKYIFGEDPEYSGFHSLLLIFSMMLLVKIANEGGLFQFLSFRLIQLTKGRPYFLMAVLDLLAIGITAIINDILAVILLIPLTVTVCRILNISPIPYIITQTILFKIGATIFIVSSVPAILISNHIQLTFIQFFINAGLISIGIAIITIILFLLIYRQRLTVPRKGIDILLEFNVDSFITSRPLLFKSIIVLVGVFLGLIISGELPEEYQKILSPDIIAFIGAVILCILSNIDLENLIQKLDYKLIIYLICVFAVTGGLEEVGFIQFFGDSVAKISPSDPLGLIIMIMWISALTSAFVDNIPVTKILIPVVGILTQGFSGENVVMPYVGMMFGLTWGDNLTPFGDTILMFNVASQNKVDIRPIQFFRISFFITLIQLSILTVGFSLAYNPITGLLLLLLFAVIAFGIYAIIHFKVIELLKSKIQMNKTK